jgi:hypothetical protein
VAQVVVCLPSKYEALSSNPNTTKKPKMRLTCQVTEVKVNLKIMTVAEKEG